MAYVIECRKSGTDCDAVLRAESMEQLQEKIAEHGKTVHNLDVATMPEEQRERIMALVHEE
jgi:predicted small metal-binding protein